MDDPFARNKKELEDALKDTPHSLLWFSLGDCDVKRQGDGGLALVMFVGDDGGVTLVLVRADVSSARYPWGSPRLTALPPTDTSIVPPYFEDWATVSRLSSVLLNLSANLAEAKTMHRLFPVSAPSPCPRTPTPLPEGYLPVFCGPLVSKTRDMYGYVSLWYAFQSSQAILLVSDGCDGSDWIAVPTKSFPHDFPFDQVKTKDGGFAPFHG